MAGARTPSSPRRWRLERGALAGLSGAFVAPALVAHFARFGICAGFVSRGNTSDWYPVYDAGRALDRIQFEVRYRRDRARQAYNQECLAQVARSSKPLIGEHDGYSDLFVPMLRDGDVTGFVACGPFRRALLSASEIRDQWKALTGRAAASDDLEYISYVRAALDTPVLDGPALDALSRVASMLAALAGDEPDTDRIMASLPDLGTAITEVNPYPIMWRAAAGFVHPLESSSWRGPYHRYRELSDLGVGELPNQVLVALPHCSAETEADAAERAVLVLALQRAAVRLARGYDDVLAGQVGDEGFFLLLRVEAESEPDRRRVLRRVAAEMRRVAGAVVVHVGAATGRGSAADLPRRYEEALLAAERAAYESSALVFRVPPVAGPTDEVQLRDLGAELVSAVVSGVPEAARALLDQLVDDVGSKAVGSSVVARTRFEAHRLELLRALCNRGILDAAAVKRLALRQGERLKAARSVHALSHAFREAMLELLGASRAPVAAARAERIRRVVEQALRPDAEPMTVARAAREAGLSRAHFCRLFRVREGVGFARFVLRAKLERARVLLATTDLPMARVGAEAGFRSYLHFERAFRREAGTVPSAYRARRRPKR